MKNSKKIILSTLIIAMAIVGVTLVYKSFVEKELEKSAYMVMNEVKNQNIMNIKTKLNGEKETLTTLSLALSEMMPFDDKVTDLLYDTVNISSFEKIYIVNKDGNVVNNEGTQLKLQDMSMFDATFNGSVVLTEVIQSFTGENSAATGLMLPIYNNDNKDIDFILMGMYLTENLNELFDTTSFGGNGYTYVLTSKGDVIASSNNENLLPENLLVYNLLKEKGYLTGTINNIKKEIESGNFGNGKGTDSYASYSPIGINDWYILTVVPAWVINSYGHNIITYTYLLIAIVSILVILLIYFIYKIQKRAYSKIKSSYAKLDAVTNQTNLGYFEYNAKEGKLLDVKNLNGLIHTHEEFIIFPRDFLKIVYEPHKEKLIKICENISEGREKESIEIRIKNDETNLYEWYEISLKTIYNGKNEYKRVIGQISALAYMDRLTGSLNYDKFNEEAQKLISSSNEYAFVVFDIDKFKCINETFGYEMGDDLLKLIAKIIEKAISNDELFARGNKDEFYILMINEDMLTKRIYSIMDEVYATFQVMYSTNYNLIFTAGIYVIDEDINDMIVIRDKAALAQKSEKGSDSSKVTFYSENMTYDLINEDDAELSTEDEFINDDFSMYLQPRYDVKTGKVVGAEAFAGWGEAPYYKSTEALKNKNLIVYIEKNLFKKACEQISIWTNAGYEPVKISIGFSNQNINNINFVNELTEIVKKYNVNPKYLELAFAESVIENNLTLLTQIVKNIHNVGFTLAMSDFGKGQSTLGLIKNITPDTIKIDSLKNHVDISRTKIVFRGILDMAKALNMKTVAQNVDNEHEMEIIKEIGCEYAQGNYYSPPVEQNKFSDFLK